jgi:hypothetical protein
MNMKLSLEEFLKKAAAPCDCEVCEANRKVATKNPFVDKGADTKEQSFSEAMAEDQDSSEEDESMAYNLTQLAEANDGDDLVEDLSGIVMMLAKRLGYKATGAAAHAIWSE